MSMSVNKDFTATRLDRQRYTEGDCAHLAKAIEQIAPWLPAYSYFNREGSMGCWDVHAFNRLPDGRRVDIAGVQSVIAFNQNWREYVQDMRKVRRISSWSELEAEWGKIHVDDYTEKVARRLVRHVEQTLRGS